MAEDIVQLIKIKADGAQAKKEAKAVESRLGQMFDRSAMKAAAFNAALPVMVRMLGAVADNAKRGFEAALLFERTTAQLKTTLDQVGVSSKAWTGALQAQSTELERLSGQSDEQIRKLQIMGLNSGVAADRVDDLMNAALRLSNAYGMSLESATRNLIKTQSGLTGELGEAVPWIREMTAEQLRAGEAIDLVNTRLDDQLAVLTVGRAGAMMGLSTAWGNFGEAIANAATEGEGSVAMFRGMSLVLEDVATIINGPGGLVEGFAALSESVLFGGKTTSERAAALREIAALQPVDDSALTGVYDFAGEAGAGGGLMFDGKKGKGKKGKGRKPTVATYRGAGDGSSEADYGVTDWTSAIGERQARQQAYADAVVEIEQNKADRIAEIERASLDEMDAARREDLAIQQQEMADKIKMATDVASIGVNAFNGFLQDMIEGSDYAAEKFAGAMLRGVGQMLQGKGMAHMAEAAAIAFIPGLQGNAAGLAAAGAAEMALGSALMAGGMAVGSSVAASEKADAEAERAAASGGPRGGGSSFSGGYQGGRGYSSGGGGDKVINITLAGPVYDGASAGRAIAEKIAEARRQGLI